MIDENENETEELEIEEVEKPETAEETARAVWDELAEKAEKEETPPAPGDEVKTAEEEKPDEISDAARKLAGAKKNKKRQTFVPADDTQGQIAEKYEPPQNWDIADKEAFLALPPLAQKNALNQFKNWQAQTTKIWQELSRERDQAKEVNHVVEAHIRDLDIPSHMTKGQVIDQLFRYQKKINADSVGALLEMMQHRRVSIADLQARATGQSAAPPQAAQAAAPQAEYLTTADVDRILAERESRTFHARAVESATEEVRNLQREMQNGRYLWPELHSQQGIDGLQDLVTYYRKITPAASWADVYKRAIVQNRQDQGLGNPSPNSQRLTQENIQTVRQASSSLRSRGGNGAIPRMSEPKANETARESAEAAYYEVFGNKQH